MTDHAVISMVTHIERDRIIYLVFAGDPTLGHISDAREVWRKEVPFPSRMVVRRLAAREQERQAHVYAIAQHAETYRGILEPLE